MQFQEILKNLRSLRGVSQAELAKGLDVSTGLIGMYENGKRKPSYSMLEAIADYFNVDIDYLTGRESRSTYLLPPEDILSEDEKLLIKLYRRLNITRKKDVKGIIAMYLSQEDEDV